MTGNICACHIHLLLCRPRTLGGAEDWLIRSLEREGALGFFGFSFDKVSYQKILRCPQPGPQASVSGHSWLLSVTAPCPLTCDPYIYPSAGNFLISYDQIFEKIPHLQLLLVYLHGSHENEVGSLATSDTSTPEKSPWNSCCSKYLVYLLI